jgi:adenosylmethionine-8-amino-7-oxononanoate aminotransferase
MSNNPSTSQATESLNWLKDKEHVVHPYTNYKKFGKEGATIYAKGEGHFIYDEAGNKYLDGIAGLWCVNIGHGREEMANVMAEQANTMAYFNTFDDAGSIPAAQLAAKLSSICPDNLNHVFFGSGGSVANDTAIKIAHYYFNVTNRPNKKKVISRDLAYHGSTYLAHALTGIEPTHDAFDLPKQLVHYLTAPHAYRNQGDRTEAEFCDMLITEFEDTVKELGADNIACFIAEPIMGAGGIIVPPEGYFKRMWEVCKANDILFIVDEVVTAFGRLGHLVTSETLFGVKPDMLVMAKGITSAYVPLGATMISDQIFEALSKPKEGNPYFTHGFTYSGHPVACAAALKNIEIIERENLCGNVLKYGEYFETQLKALEELPIVGNVRGKCYMIGLELVKDKETKEGFDDDLMVARRVYAHCKQRGLIIRPVGDILILSPPLTYDKAAIDETVRILTESFHATMEDLREEGALG